MLSSSISQYYYNFGFGNFIPPAALDAGHPPLFYSYIAFLMKVFGKSLWVVHLSILPFTLLGILSFVRILDFFSFPKKNQLLAVFLYFCIPAVTTQQMMVSYDMALLSLYLSAIYAVLFNRRILFSFILILIVGVSLRGIVALVSIFFTLYILNDKKFKSTLRWVLLMIPALIFCFVWYYFHKMQTGWWLSTSSASWSGQRGIVDVLGFFKNLISLARCFFDYGIVTFTIFYFFHFLKGKIIDKLILIWLIPLLVFALSFLPFRNPINHRYFLIVYVLMIPYVVIFLTKRRFLFSVLVGVLLLLSNFMIYPGKISNGWDCTLAHHSYFSLRKQFNAYFIQHKLDRTQIGTVFPMSTSFSTTDFSEDTTAMLNVNGSNIESVPYVLYSNIANDFSDEQMDKLSNWKIVRQDHLGLVSMSLLQNPNFTTK